MKATLVIAGLSFLLGSVMADNCHAGLQYCGSTLLSIGKYQGQIDQSYYDVVAEGFEAPDNGKNILFGCSGGRSGVIKYFKTCTTGCHDAGTDKSDYCNSASVNEDRPYPDDAAQARLQDL
ncbi:hypothetical protein MMC19_002814 [Ptychographa xylographoides]|nr:hypothetical protein [Ptychographa xylographoides]